MGADKLRLEASLVSRRDLDKRDGAFDADVTRAWIENSSKWLTVVTDQRFAIAVRTVSLDDYIVRSVTLYDSQYKEGYTEAYSTSEHEQSRAFETLKSICEEEEVGSSLDQAEGEGEGVPSPVGPKRLEITLRAESGSAERRLVVTDVMPPAAHYRCYSVAGREWKAGRKGLYPPTVTLWASTWQLSRIDAYLAGGQGSATEYFTPQDQERAWSTLEGMFYKFKSAEIQVVRKWDADEAESSSHDDLCGYSGEWYGPTHRGQHWTNRAPAAYIPKKAYYRVAGDEVGAVIHREQKKVWEEAGSPSPAQTLKAILELKPKKEDAGNKSPDRGPSSTRSNAVGSRYNSCGGSECPTAYCIDDPDLATFGGRVAGDAYTVH